MEQQRQRWNKDGVQGRPLVPPLGGGEPFVLFHLFHFFVVLFHHEKAREPLYIAVFMTLLYQVEQVEQCFYKIGK